MDPSLVVKATAILAAGLIASLLAARVRASIRHLTLALTFAALAALPLVSLFVTPAVAITVMLPSPDVLPDRASDLARALEDRIAPPPATTTTGDAAAPLPITTIVRGIWAAGTAVLSVGLTFGLFQLRHARRHGLPWAEGGDMARDLARKAGIRRSIDVLLHEGIAAPITCGFMRPAIVLPSDAHDWARVEIQRALVHELEHVRRADWATQVLGRIVCAVYWFHPLVWVAWRQLVVHSERACDDAVLAAHEGEDYAAQLLTLARRLSGASAQPALAMASRSDLSTRVSAVLDHHQRRGPAGRRAVVAGVMATLVTVAILAPIGDVRAQVRRSDRGTRAYIAGLTPSIVEATEAGDLQAVVDLLNLGASANATLPGDGSPLIVAARAGHTDIIRLLLDRGADPNLAVVGDGNPLIMAAREGHRAIVELLLDRGADPNRVVFGDENALIQASWQGHLDVVQLLVGRGADVNARIWSGREWRTARGMAWRDGHDDVVRFLESAGARE